ncbi:MAG: helix-turn-helix transcriptional regulator [Eggerthellaceae bacterium]|nr:helix-turn-helix transcriptional regulator [Eggerthellaceae bacterium]
MDSGKALRGLMERDGVAVEQVAAAIGRRPQTVARWLNGEGRGFTVREVINVHAALFGDMTRAEFLEIVAPA